MSPNDKKGLIMKTQNRLISRIKQRQQQNNQNSPRITATGESQRMRSTIMIDTSEQLTPQKPIMYKGTPLVTNNDILKLFNFTPQQSPLEEQDKNIESKKFVDEEYLKLIRNVRPKKKYFQYGLGDKLLFLEKVDRINYDIVDEERKRKVTEHEHNLEKARKQLEIQ